MKLAKRLMTILAVALVLFSFNSCKDDDGDGVPDILDKMTATIDGQQWSSVARVATYTSTEAGDIITITATSGVTAATGEFLNLIIRGSELRTYDLTITLVGSEFECTANYKPDASGTDIYTGQSGTITLTKFDSVNKKISGTFSFTVAKVGELTTTKQITNGTFTDLVYQVTNAK